MGRRGSISFIIEVKRSKRRFAANPGRAEDPNSKGDVPFGAVRPGSLAATPFSQGPRGYDPSVEAAKVAADRLFNRLGGSASAPDASWNDQSAPTASIGAPPQAPGVLVQGSASSPSAAPSPSPAPGLQRTGRILESLTSVNPLDALFRQKAEERAARRRGPRTSRTRSVPGELPAGLRSDNKHGSSGQSAADQTGDPVVATSKAKEPRGLRTKPPRKTAAQRFADQPKSRRKRKTAVKSRRRMARPIRTIKNPIGTKRTSRKSATKATLGARRTPAKKAARKALAKTSLPKKKTTRKAVARKPAKSHNVRKRSTTRVASRSRARSARSSNKRR